MGFGCGNSCGGDSSLWIIILLIFCGGLGGSSCGTGCGTTGECGSCGGGFGGSWIWILILLFCCGGEHRTIGCGGSC